MGELEQVTLVKKPQLQRLAVWTYYKGAKRDPGRDEGATTVAYWPLVDELGQSNLGKNFADRPFIPTLKRTLRPMLSEVVMGRIGVPKPMVTALARPTTAVSTSVLVSTSTR